MPDKPKICVILGAGVSHDVHGDGSVYKTAGDPLRWRPPLASELFDINNKRHYLTDAMVHYPDARYLTQDIARQLQIGGLNLEAELRRLSRHHDPETQRQFKQIPPYIRDVIMMCSYEYTEELSSYATLTRTLLAEVPHEILFLTLNYDNMLERALEARSPEFNFNKMEKYVHTGTGVSVVQLHGSIDWFRLIAPQSIDWYEALMEVNLEQKVPDSDIVIVRQRSPTFQIISKNQRVYPVLTAPLAGKEAQDVVCPESHIQEVTNFLTDCSKFLVIGCSGLDDDLMGVLQESIPSDRETTLAVVDTSDKEARKVLRRFARGVTAFGPHEKPIEGRTFVSQKTFLDYLREGDLLEFANLKG